MLLKGPYCVGEHFVDPQCPKVLVFGMYSTEFAQIVVMW